MVCITLFGTNTYGCARTSHQCEESHWLVLVYLHNFNHPSRCFAVTMHRTKWTYWPMHLC